MLYKWTEWRSHGDVQRIFVHLGFEVESKCEEYALSMIRNKLNASNVSMIFNGELSDNNS